MHVRQIDLSYTDDEDSLATAVLHVCSHTPTGQEIFRQLALEPAEVRTLEALLERALRRVSHRALTLV